MTIAVTPLPKQEGEKKKVKRPRGWYSKAAKEKRADARKKRAKERQDIADARADHQEAKKRIDERARKRGEAMMPSLHKAADRIQAKGRAVMQQWAQERAAEAERKKPKRRGRKDPKPKPSEPKEVSVYAHGRRLKIQTRLDPLAAMANKGQIDSAQWQASKLFSKDFEASHFSGLGGLSLEPAVDGGGGDRGNPAVVASLRLRQLRDKIGDESYMVLVACCGYGFTITQLHHAGAGQATTIGTQLKDALVKADAFYTGRERHEPSKLMKTVQRMVQEMERIVERSTQ